MQPGSDGPEYQAWPTLRRLVRVIPVEQIQRHGEVELALQTLEIYDDGFLVRLRLSYPDRGRRFPEPVFAVRDDRGGKYGWAPGPDLGSERTGGSARGWRYEAALSFAPALDPAARELAITITEVRWRLLTSPPNFGRGPARPDDEVAPGPWNFTILLTA